MSADTPTNHPTTTAARPPDFIAAGRSVWRAESDDPDSLRSYWYHFDGPECGRCFYVRDLPGFTECDPEAEWGPEDDKQQEHHAGIIARCVEQGGDPIAITELAAHARAERAKARMRANG